MTNSTSAALIIIIALILVIGFALWMYLRKKRTESLRTKFGPEYDKAIGEHRDRSHAESDLEQRAKRVAKYEIHPLSTQDREHYASEWRREQAQFVDDPQGAVKHADVLVQEVMHVRGYPVGNFEQNANDLSVEHPRVVEHYRIAHEIAIRETQGQATTEDLRRAMVSYRALFEDLVGQSINKPEEARR